MARFYAVAIDGDYNIVVEFDAHKCSPDRLLRRKGFDVIEDADGHDMALHMVGWARTDEGVAAIMAAHGVQC